MTSATLGELLRVADAHLQDAETVRDGVISPDAATARDLQALVRALAQYIAHVGSTPTAVAIVAGNAERSGIWDYTAVEVREALHLACDALGRGAALAPDLQANEKSPTPLARAAKALASGRDLLTTHVRSDADGSLTGSSDWAQVITSYPVTRAITDEIAGWSQLLAPWVRWIASQPPGEATDGIRAALATASHYLELAGRAAFVARKAEPVSEDDRELLRGIPLATPAERIPVQPGESVTDLCAGLSETAERLRTIAFNMASHAAWAPGITARAWRHTATGAAVAFDTAVRTLQTLARPQTPLREAGIGTEQLTAVADDLARACTAWRDAAFAWNTITTETRFASSRIIAEIDDLVLRTGRLAFADPRWAPDTRHPEPREPGALASTRRGVLDVLSAVYQVADALTAMASGDLAAITVAAEAGRLFVPARSLPDAPGWTHRHSPLTPDRTEQLFQSYRTASSMSESAARALADIVLDAGGPSRMLALARRAYLTARAPSTPPITVVGSQGPGAIPYLTEVLRAYGDVDPGLLLRAAAIDRAATEVVNEARRAAQLPPLEASPVLKHLGQAANAAQLASKDQPGGQVSQADSRPSRPERRPLKSANRARRADR